MFELDESHLKEQMETKLGRKVDIHHYPKVKGVLVIEHNQPPTNPNIIHALSYAEGWD